ncbi:MAG: glycosyltransferase [Bacteroidales bacterium]
MTTQKKILIVYPHNFLERGSGVNKRYVEFVAYLREKGFTIDLLGLRHFKSTWRKEDIEESGKMINRLFLYDFRIGYHKQRLISLLSGRKFPGLLPDFAFPGMKSMFRKIVRNNHYDFIIIGYVYWANLLKGVSLSNAVSVLTIEDFISQKLAENSAGSTDRERSEKEEIGRVNLFDKVICLSDEEMKFFISRTTHPGYFYVPIFMDQPVLLNREKEFDILFIGFDNADNIEGLAWFFTKIHPLLRTGLKIVVVGKIARYAPDLPTVTRMEYVEDPGEVYSKSRISINPLQQGTGMKVKVVESLAYQTPIVNTSKGVCGIPPEILGKFIVADDPQDFATEIHRLLSEPGWYDEKCREAKELFTENFASGIAKITLDKLFLTNNFHVSHDVPL